MSEWDAGVPEGRNRVISNNHTTIRMAFQATKNNKEWIIVGLVNFRAQTYVAGSNHGSLYRMFQPGTIFLQFSPGDSL